MKNKIVLTEQDITKMVKSCLSNFLKQHVDNIRKDYPEDARPQFYDGYHKINTEYPKGTRAYIWNRIGNKTKDVRDCVKGKYDTFKNDLKQDIKDGFDPNFNPKFDEDELENKSH